MPDIKDWIREQLEAGYTPDQIRASLQKVGYDPNLVNEVIGKTPEEASIKKAEKMGILEKIKTVLTSPTEFFSRVGGEGITEALKYYVIISLAVSLWGNLINYYFKNVHLLTILELLKMGAFGILILWIFGVMFVVLFGFIYAGALHIFAKLLRGVGNYSQTYKAFIYSCTPSLLLSWIPHIGPLFALWAWYLGIKGLSKLHNVSMLRAFVITLMPIMVPVVLMVILVLIVLVLMPVWFAALLGAARLPI